MIYGVDVSHYQGSINWGQVRADGIDFAMCKATEPGFDDATYARNVAGARRAGLVVGAYHFLHTGDGAGQARHYLSVLRGAGGTRGLGIVIDAETTASGQHPGRSEVSGFVSAIRSALGSARPVTLYTGRWYWHDTLGDPDLTGLRVALWESRYVSGQGAWRSLAHRVQSGWFDQVRCGGLRPSLIQYSSSARVAGVSGDCDVDAFPGTREQLRARLIGGQEADVISKDEFRVDLQYSLGNGDIHRLIRRMAAEGAVEAILTRPDVQAKLEEIVRRALAEPGGDTGSTTEPTES